MSTTLSITPISRRRSPAEQTGINSWRMEAAARCRPAINEVSRSEQWGNGKKRLCCADAGVEGLMTSASQARGEANQAATPSHRNLFDIYDFLSQLMTRNRKKKTIPAADADRQLFFSGGEKNENVAMLSRVLVHLSHSSSGDIRTRYRVSSAEPISNSANDCRHLPSNFTR